MTGANDGRVYKHKIRHPDTVQSRFPVGTSNAFIYSRTIIPMRFRIPWKNNGWEGTQPTNQLHLSNFLWLSSASASAQPDRPGSEIWRFFAWFIDT
ncbi:UNVERIFIED_CONTAM: hypothetical protein PYX00_010168 [Menopon gallinae]|uniref:Uncharacterized protein n=1 Tax=Menopon gallinae TaxID=328185 RepID=A0AAW2HE77_9NEOP